MGPRRFASPYFVLAALFLACAFDACAAPGRATSGAPSRASSAEAARTLPSLEQIFFLPGPQGKPPTVQSLSSDGQWAFVRWSPLATQPDGTRELENSDALRLVATQVATPYNGAGPSARELFALTLPPDAKPEERDSDPSMQWSRNGHRLALARGGDLWLADAPENALDLRSWQVKPLIAHLEHLRSFEFVEDDRALRVDDGKQIYEFDLARDFASQQPLALTDARQLTKGLEVATGSVEWSRDFKTVFSRRGAFGSPPAAPKSEPSQDTAAKQDPPKKDGASEEKSGKAQILHLEDHRAVELAELAELKNVDGLSLSPDGRFVIGEQSERGTEPPPNLIPDYLTARVSTHDARRERAEDVGPTRKVFVWNTDTGAKSEVVFPGEPSRSLRALGWSKSERDGALCVFSRISEDWKTFEVFAWTEKGLTRIFEDHDERWYGGPNVGANWSADGRVLIVGSESTSASTTPGRCQLFALDPHSGLIRQLTNVAGEVSQYDTNRDGALVFVASDGDPTRRVIGYVSPEMVRGESGGHSHWLTTPVGYQNSVRLAAHGERVLFAHQSIGRPAELWCTALAPDATARALTRTVPKEFASVDWIRPETFSTVNREGSKLWAHVYSPRGHTLEHPDRPRACVCFIHGAGYLQNVTDSMTEYEPNLMFHSRLADEGYVVVDVDYRGSSGYGSRFRSDVQNRLGELELVDLHAVLDALGAKGVIDVHRVGCYGGSYGGFLTLMALFTEPGRWKCGAALRSVTDWRSYHPAYTQPRLGRPSKNEAAYKRSSPIDLAEGLKDPLLILHGMQDSNVFAQDSVRLIEKLITLGKDFEAMLYPSQDHQFTSGHHWVDEYRRIERFMHEHLGEP